MGAERLGHLNYTPRPSLHGGEQSQRFFVLAVDQQLIRNQQFVRLCCSSYLPIAGLPGAGLLLEPGFQRASVERLTASKPEGIPVDCARFREVDQVKHAFGIEVRARLLWASEHEAATTNLTDIFTGLLGHGIDQVEVGHTDVPP